MTRPQFELPPAARELIEQVRALEDRAQRVTEELGHDLAGIRKAATEERATVDRELTDQRRQAEAQLREVTEKTASERARLAEDRAALEALLASRVRGFDFIANAWADYEAARAADEAFELETKDHPAYTAAERIRMKGEQLAQTRRELKRSQWVLALYEWHFPWLTDLRELRRRDIICARRARCREWSADDDEQPADPAQQWLSQEEFRALPEVERNQRALDRYLRSRKTPWQLGRDYERYIGYLREAAGARVTYQGIFAGLEDLGRDLLAERDGVIEVIQCKRWAQHKTIHEKHVFQLFGTVVAAASSTPTVR